MKSTYTQQTQILEALNNGARLTGLDGLRVAGTMKLSTRIGELIKRGHPIKSDWIERNGKRIKEYWIDEAERKVS